MLVGKQHSYLMTVQGKPAGYLQQVLHSVDARFLRIQGQYARDGLGAVLIAERPEQVAALDYGNALRLGDFMCSSAESGVTCTNTATGHAVKLNRQEIVLR